MPTVGTIRFSPTNDDSLTFCQLDFLALKTNDGDGVLPVEVSILSNELEGRPADNEMALIVERRDRGNGVNMVNRVRVLLAPFRYVSWRQYHLTLRFAFLSVQWRMDELNPLTLVFLYP